MKTFICVLHKGADMVILMSEIANGVTLCYLSDQIQTAYFCMYLISYQYMGLSSEIELPLQS